jgi:hypothetical protein
MIFDLKVLITTVLWNVFIISYLQKVGFKLCLIICIFATIIRNNILSLISCFYYVPAILEEKWVLKIVPLLWWCISNGMVQVVCSFMAKAQIFRIKNNYWSFKVYKIIIVANMHIIKQSLKPTFWLIKTTKLFVEWHLFFLILGKLSININKYKLTLKDNLYVDLIISTKPTIASHLKQ